MSVLARPDVDIVRRKCFDLEQFELEMQMIIGPLSVMLMSARTWTQRGATHVTQQHTHAHTHSTCQSAKASKIAGPKFRPNSRPWSERNGATSGGSSSRRTSTTTDWRAGIRAFALLLAYHASLAPRYDCEYA